MLAEQRAMTTPQVEHSDALVLAAKDDDSAIIRPGQRAHDVTEHDRCVERTAALGIPGAKRAIGAGAREEAASFGDRKSEHGPAMADEPPLRVRGAIVDQQRAELAAHGEARAVLRPGEGADRLAELEMSRGARKPAVPHAHLPPRIAARHGLRAAERQRGRFLTAGCELKCAIGGRGAYADAPVREGDPEGCGVACETERADLGVERGLERERLRAHAPDSETAPSGAREQVSRKRQRAAGAALGFGPGGAQRRSHRASARSSWASARAAKSSAFTLSPS